MRKNRILAIGVESYDDSRLNTLNNCTSDIKAILKILNEKYEFYDTEFLFKKEDTTRQKIYQKLRWFFTHALQDDNLLLLYSGHGEYDEILNAAYWQPSDARQDDVSSWFNLADLMAFTKATKAHHVAIISDSCFAGALFTDPLRGGGVPAFNDRRSREAIASGGLEKVSDGAKGTSSPFCIQLIRLLEENELKQFPFTMLGNELVLSFGKEKKQTPRSDSLVNVGHEGGSFIFELRDQLRPILSEAGPKEILKQRMKTLFLQVPIDFDDDIKELGGLVKLKWQIVKAQKYEEASAIRAKEKKVMQALETKYDDYLAERANQLLEHAKYSEQEIERQRRLDEDLANYRKLIALADTSGKTKKAVIAHTHIIPHHILQKQIDFLFVSHRDELATAFEQNVLNLYEMVIKIKGHSKDEAFDTAIEELRKILVRIFLFQVNLLTNGSMGYLDEVLTIKKIEIEILTWIQKQTGDIWIKRYV